MEQIQDFWNTAIAIFVAGDFVGMGMKIAAIIVASLFLQSVGSLLNGILVALILSTLGSYIRSIIDVSGGLTQVTKNFDGATAKHVAADRWNTILGLNGKTLLVYAVTFGAGVLIAYGLRIMIFGNRERNTRPSGGMSMPPIVMAAPVTPIVHHDQPQVAHAHFGHEDHATAADYPAEQEVHHGSVAAHADHETTQVPASEVTITNPRMRMPSTSALVSTSWPMPAHNAIVDR